MVSVLPAIESCAGFHDKSTDKSRFPSSIITGVGGCAGMTVGGWSWGCVSPLDREGRTIWIADAHRDNGKRFVAHAEEKLTAFLELEAAITAAQE
jgi:hypothetical protein